MVKRDAEFAKAADMLAEAKGTKEVFLRTLNKKVVIRKINIGDVASVMKIAKDSDMEQFIYLCFKGLKKPKLTIKQARALPVKVIVELSAEIAKFSELDKESIDKVRNLLATGS